MKPKDDVKKFFEVDSFKQEKNNPLNSYQDDFEANKQMFKNFNEKFMVYLQKQPEYK